MELVDEFTSKRVDETSHSFKKMYRKTCLVSLSTRLLVY